MNKKILIIIISLIMIFSMSWNLYQWKYMDNLEKIETGLNNDFEELKLMIDSNDKELLKKIEQIEEYSKFQQSYCFEK